MHDEIGESEGMGGRGEEGKNVFSFVNYNCG